MRLVLLLYSWDIPPVFDELAYTQNADQILEHGVYAGTYRPPLLSYYIAGMFLLFGKGMFLVKLMQVVIGSMTVLLVTATGKEAISERAGLFAGLIYALDPKMAWYSCFLWPETLFTALFLGCFYALVRYWKKGGLRYVIAAGALFGLSALTKGMILYFSAFIVLWLYFACRPRTVLAAVVFLAGVAVTIGPWTVRNYYETGAFVPVDSNGMYNLYSSNNAIRNYGESIYSKEGLKEINNNYARLGKTQIEREKGAMKEALKYIWSEQPWWFFKKLYHELPMLVTPALHPLRHIKMGYYGRLNPVLVDAVVLLYFASFLFLLITSLSGMVYAERTAGYWWIAGLVAYTSLVYISTYATPRYNFIMLPFLMYYSGYALTKYKEMAGMNLKNAVLLILIAGLLALWYGSYTYRYMAGMMVY